jgi:hypothetical protein
MRFLAVEGYKVIALRDLAKYVDPTIKPSSAMGVVEDRKEVLAKKLDYQNTRLAKNDAELSFWLRNMLQDHKFSLVESAAATGMSTTEIAEAAERLKIVEPTQAPPNQLKVLPYPGGRHPRIGFRDGAIRPQRETKLSVFFPWDQQSYVVADVPEAIWWGNQGKRELLYLAHTHVKTTWDLKGESLPKVEWQQQGNSWRVAKRLPNSVEFGCEAEPKGRELHLKLWIKNGSNETLTGLVVQNCMMLANAEGFNQMANDNKLIERPFVVCSNASKTRHIITGWQNCVRPWANPPCPCMHSDPQFPDCSPGETQELLGILAFYEGQALTSELERLRAFIEP